jgi:delta24(24(1))-sterol reductase
LTDCEIPVGAVLNPRIGSVDIKMCARGAIKIQKLTLLDRIAEVRLSWYILFLIAVAGCVKQYHEYGYVAPNLYFMVMASGLQVNACVSLASAKESG